MNFEGKIRDLESQQESLAQSIRVLRNQYKSAVEFTGEFLDSCAKEGLTKVAIGVAHKSLPESIAFPFGAAGSIFAIGPMSTGGGRDEFGWPAIWGVCDRAGISAGCGNSMQQQANLSNLIDGVYHLRAGVWHKIQEE